VLWISGGGDLMGPQTARRLYAAQKREADAVLAHHAAVEAAHRDANVEDRHRAMVAATVPVDPADMVPGDVVVIDRGRGMWRVERVVRVNAGSVTLEGGLRVGRGGTFRRFRVG